MSRSFATSDARVRPPVVSVSNLPLDDTVPFAHLARPPIRVPAGLTPAGKAGAPLALSPDSRRVLGDVANAARAPSSPALALAAKLCTPSPVVSSETFDGWRVNSNPSFSPSAEVTERASMPPKSPAEELAQRAALAAAKIRRGGSASPPDYASHTTPSPTDRPRRSGSGSCSGSGGVPSSTASSSESEIAISGTSKPIDLQSSSRLPSLKST